MFRWLIDDLQGNEGVKSENTEIMILEKLSIAYYNILTNY